MNIFNTQNEIMCNVYKCTLWHITTHISCVQLYIVDHRCLRLVSHAFLVSRCAFIQLCVVTSAHISVITANYFAHDFISVDLFKICVIKVKFRLACINTAPITNIHAYVTAETYFNICIISGVFCLVF